MREGDPVQDFEAVDHRGKAVRLSDLLLQGPVVLFFYPKAMSPGCTAEACRFRDLSGEFAGRGATVLGISPDSVEGQARFAQANQLGMPLLADPDRRIAKRFGVGRLFGLPVRRVTFVIGRDGRVIRRIASPLDMDQHADEALIALP